MNAAAKVRRGPQKQQRRGPALFCISGGISGPAARKVSSGLQPVIASSGFPGRKTIAQLNLQLNSSG
uniref:Uncharacterized protein n=1 Tax=uncultured bacterium Contig46 TaxID=1393580 RepID=W0FMA8_9BACT|nr:hypothetical protein [uncultured bacterium Contig46]